MQFGFSKGNTEQIVQYGKENIFLAGSYSFGEEYSLLIFGNVDGTILGIQFMKVNVHVVLVVRCGGCLGTNGDNVGFIVEGDNGNAFGWHSV